MDIATNFSKNTYFVVQLKSIECFDTRMCVMKSTRTIFQQDRKLGRGFYELGVTLPGCSGPTQHWRIETFVFMAFQALCSLQDFPLPEKFVLFFIA